MTSHLEPIASVEALDAETEGSVIAVLARDHVRWLWLRSGKEWIALDPGDRTDGEETTPSFSVFHHHANPARGRSIVKLWEPGQTGHGVITGAQALEALPVESVVLFDEGEWWPLVWQRSGKEWLEMDPSDKSDGEMTLPSRLLPAVSPDARILHLWSLSEGTVR